MLCTLTVYFNLPANQLNTAIDYYFGMLSEVFNAYDLDIYIT